MERSLLSCSLWYLGIVLFYRQRCALTVEHFKLGPDLLWPTSAEVCAQVRADFRDSCKGSMLRRTYAWCKALFLPSQILNFFNTGLLILTSHQALQIK